MSIFYIFAVIITILFITLAIILPKNGGPGKSDKKFEYHYKRKNFFLTRAEHEFYDTLVLAVGQEYRIFAQVHLPTIVDHKVPNQDWRAALAHINRKSVDFVLCDTKYLSPKLAIELDDKTHEREDRKERDGIVEQILKEAGVPLLRIENHGHFDTVKIAEQIKSAIK